MWSVVDTASVEVWAVPAQRRGPDLATGEYRGLPRLRVTCRLPAGRCSDTIGARAGEHSMSTRRLRFSPAKAYRHLAAADPVVGDLIERHGPYRPRPSGQPYHSLLRAILYQQLAGNAAAAIERRLHAIYDTGERPPTPTELLATTDEAFRGAGVSRQKAGYLRDLAQHMVDGSLDFTDIEGLTDDEVVTRLTAVKGVGEWTAHMFLMFQLGRPDVLPVGDLGVRKGMQVAYGLDEAPTPARALEIGGPWAPYRSVGSWYMWRAAETVVPD
ncbi:MAG: DNA-3-methyladenine glycosylase 2 family protein [Dehalococcoidia bacterium]|nr:DNA-3-methyladenine glycosylase 2 family protein [Dehalococcoidia bacterium]